MSPRIRAETIAITIRSAIAFLLVGYYNWGIIGFGYAQVSYGITYFVILSAHTYIIDIKDITINFSIFIPKYTSNHEFENPINHHQYPDNIQYFISNQFGSSSLQTVISMYSNSIIKYILTEADKIILSFFASHYNQGLYAVAHNYGSLVARLFFLPLEEGSRILFSKYLVTIYTNIKQYELIIIKENNQNEIKYLSNISIENLNKKFEILFGIIKLLIIFCSLFLIFGPSYVRLFIAMVLGDKWYTEEMVYTLISFCPYLFIMGLNGVTEAYVMSVTPTTTMKSSLNIGMITSTIVFGIVVFPFMRVLGTSGLVYANLISMSVRLIFNLYFIRNCAMYPWNALHMPVLQQMMVQYLAEEEKKKNMNDNNNINETETETKIRNRKESIDMKDMNSIIFIRNPLLKCIPPFTILLSLVFGGLLALLSSIIFIKSALGIKDTLLHVSFGLVSFCMYAFALWRWQYKDLLSIYRMLRAKQD